MMKQPLRGRVSVALGDIEETSLETLEALILSVRLRAAREGITNLRIEIDVEHGYCDGVSARVRIVGMRDETDEEMQRRMQVEQLRVERGVAQRRHDYEVLRREFEGE